MPEILWIRCKIPINKILKSKNIKIFNQYKIFNQSINHSVIDDIFILALRW